MKIKKPIKKVVILSAICATISCGFSSAAVAATAPVTVINHEEITDIEELKYRIDNNITDLTIEGMATEPTTYYSEDGTVKTVVSAPTIQKLQTIQRSSGEIEEKYVLTTISQMSAATSSTSVSGSAFTAAVDYVTKFYFVQSVMQGINGGNLYRPIAGEIAITALRNNFTITNILVNIGGGGWRYNASGTILGWDEYTETDSRSGSNVASLYVPADYPYYFEIYNMKGCGVGTNGRITAKHGSYSYTANVTPAAFGSRF